MIIPLLYRKRLKAYLEQVIAVQAQNSIPVEVSQVWSRAVATELPDIVIFGMIAYDFRFQRPQQLAAHLARIGHRVFYIEHEFRPARAMSDKAPFSVRQAVENLFVVRLTSDRNYFIYGEQMSERGKRVIQASLRSLQENAKLYSTVWIAQHPFWDTVLPDFCRPLVYEVFDDHSGFAQAGKWVSQQEQVLAKRADQIIVSSRGLQQRFDQLSSRVTLIANGADTHSLSRLPSLPMPDQLKHLNQPIIGYHGAIEEWFDVELMEKLLRSYPQASFVLIGAVHNQAVLKLADRYSNLHLLGEVPYQQLPAYLQDFQVGIIPFLLTPVIQATLPVKFFEYLALGKPVVSTSLPELKPYKQLCYLAGNANDFMTQLEAALIESKPELMSQRQAEAVKHDWHLLVQQLSHLLTHL